MRVLVVGDRIGDFYVFGSVSRLCPEAPVPVFVPSSSECRDGGAALVAANLRALGVTVDTYYKSYSEKTRYFADHHLLLRVDRDSLLMVTSSILDPSNVDAIVVSDYGKGTVNDDVITTLLGSGKPVFVDAKHDLSRYGGAFAAFPNQHEHLDADLSRFVHVIRKLGAEGCRVDHTPCPTVRQQVYDVTGAGDVFLAAFVYKWLQTKDLLQAAAFANRTAGESVRHLGTYVVPEGFDG